ncbi:MAG: hypothetical protein KAW12_23350 [Candidatus Aminicenantes bacterium]|nr:hypothetical protein [Candidatus Aminicenantes bacterium]
MSSTKSQKNGKKVLDLHPENNFTTSPPTNAAGSEKAPDYSCERLFAVTGNPVLHSKSPLIFNTLFRELSIDALYLRVAASTPLEALFLSRKLKLTGMNVTAPFKKSIMAFLDSVEEAAAVIGGVNTIVLEDGRLRGYNTDYTGVTRSLRERGITIGGRNCVVLGAGGAGRAAVYGLIKEKGDVCLVNRTYEKAVAAAKDLGCRAEKIEQLESLLQKADIFVSTLSSSVDIVPGEWLPGSLVVFDANYKSSPLSQKAQARGCCVLKGEEWLLHQALPAFRYFLAATGLNGALKLQEKELSKSFAGVQGAVFQKSPLPAGGKKKNLTSTIKSSLLSRPPGFKNISLVGFMGSGKTIIGKKLAAKMGFFFVDTDEQIEIETGCSVPEIFESRGEAGFRALEKSVIKKLLLEGSGTVFSCGGGVVTDEENRRILAENSVVIWLYVTVRTALGRIRRGTRPLLDGEDRGRRARSLLSSRLPFYSRAAHIIVSSENDVDEVVEKIHEEISKTFEN